MAQEAAQQRLERTLAGYFGSTEEAADLLADSAERLQAWSSDMVGELSAAASTLSSYSASPMLSPTAADDAPDLDELLDMGPEELRSTLSTLSMQHRRAASMQSPAGLAGAASAAGSASASNASDVGVPNNSPTMLRAGSPREADGRPSRSTSRSSDLVRLAAAGPSTENLLGCPYVQEKVPLSLMPVAAGASDGSLSEGA